MKIRAKRTFHIQAGPTHQSKNNIVALYIGLPTPDAAQDNIVIEDITSQRANRENIIFSPQNDSLLVEYVDVLVGFRDEITLTFSVELYCRKTELSQIEEQPYNRESSLYKQYTTLSDKNLVPVLQKHLERMGCDPEQSALRNAREIYLYLGKQLQYGAYTPDESVPEDLLDGGKAHCGIYAKLFSDLCRQAGIPARRCAGFYLKANPEEPNQTVVSPHNWAEFYVEGTGWIPVDPIFGDKPDKRKRYYFGNLDNGHLCVSKDGLHHPLPIWYKTSENGELIYAGNIDELRPGLYPQTIQGAHRVQYRWDLPIQIIISNQYGAENLKVLSSEGFIEVPEQ